MKGTSNHFSYEIKSWPLKHYAILFLFQHVQNTIENLFIKNSDESVSLKTGSQKQKLYLKIGSHNEKCSSELVTGNQNGSQNW